MIAAFLSIKLAMGARVDLELMNYNMRDQKAKHREGHQKGLHPGVDTLPNHRCRCGRSVMDSIKWI